MSKLHHKSMRYELQEWVERTLSWKPIAHAPTEEAIRTAFTAAYRKATHKLYRVLDRKDGARKAKVVSLTAKN